MPDILIRDVPDDVLAVIDDKAKRMGLSRSQYLRRALERERADASTTVTVDDLSRLAERAGDLDSTVMDDAWS